jgi:Zn-dependent protease with chaperone function
MLSFFSGKYYDAQANTLVPVKVHATQRFVGIDFIDYEGVVLNTVYWPHEKISLEKLPDSPTQVKLVYGDQYLELPFDFLKEVKAAYRFAPYLSVTNKALRHYKWPLIAGFSVLIAVSVWFLFWKMASALVYVVPQKTEVELGDLLTKQVLQQQHLKIDSLSSQLTNDFYAHVHTNTTYKIKILVVEGTTMNAFALPGGNIVVYKALLTKIKTPEALVALLGHETGHIQERHALKAILKNTSFYLFLSMILGDFNGASGTLLAKIADLHDLSYSRANETESDMFALAILQHNKMNPMGMIELFQLLKTQDHAEAIPGVLLTHPKLEDRITQVHKEIAKGENQVEINPAITRSFKAITSLIH